MLNRGRNRIAAEVFLAVEENNNGKDSRKKNTKKKRQDLKKTLCYQGSHQVDGYLEFRIALICPHPRLPTPSLACLVTHAKTVLLQDYQIQLQLRTVELH